MTTRGWRNLALVLAVVCAFQQWRSCTRSHASLAPATAEQATAAVPAGSTGSVGSTATSVENGRSHTARPALPEESGARTFYGFKIPAWVMHFAPQPGENLRDYRDRMLPLVRTAIAPQRARVSRALDDFGALDAHQRAELDGAVQEAAAAIQDRVMNGVLSGELRPGTFKPMTGVTVARDVLDIIDRGNTRFQNSLTPDQRTRLASHRFDFADYLLFSSRWEDAFAARK
jgi:hypothetical protein